MERDGPTAATSPVYEDGLDGRLDPSDKARNEAMFHVAGDKVRIAAGAARLPRHDELVDAASWARAGTLTVKRVHFAERGVEYAFEEVDGLWNAGHVEDHRGPRHVFGTVVVRDGVRWLVSLGEAEPHRPDPSQAPMRLAPSVGRYVAWEHGGSRDVAVLDGALGEFRVVPEGDAFETVGVPWRTDAKTDETAAALDALPTEDAETNDASGPKA